MGRDMAVRRWVLAILLALYAAGDALNAAYITSLKFGWTRPKGAMARMAPIADSASVLQLALGWAAIVIFFAVALRLVQRKQSLDLYAIGFFLSLASWLMFRLGDAYDRVFGRFDRHFDYVLIAVMLMFGLAIWLIERANGGK